MNADSFNELPPNLGSIIGSGPGVVILDGGRSDKPALSLGWEATLADHADDDPVFAHLDASDRNLLARIRSGAAA